MRIIIVGGTFGDVPKESKIIKEVGAVFEGMTNCQSVTVVNGGTIEQLGDIASFDQMIPYDLVLWMPNVSNDVEKIYPKKYMGAVLVCSKVVGLNDRDYGDAVARIFKMNGNAVIAIDKSNDPYEFVLLDALGNKWSSNANISAIVESIVRLYEWTNLSIRMNSLPVTFDDSFDVSGKLEELCDITRKIADVVEAERGGRYFGNVSTRCAAMFPSMRLPNDLVLMSARNVDKQRLSSSDFVFTRLNTCLDHFVAYEGVRKPSVDAPIQLSIYNTFDSINFIVHGHAYIDGAPFTENYYPCGDMREYVAVKGEVMSSRHKFVINLKNHGFLIGASTLMQLKDIVDSCRFQYRELYKQIEE